MNNFAMPRPDGGPATTAQILYTALQDEHAAWAFYTSAAAAFGNQAPWQTLLTSTTQRVTTLGNLCLQYGIPRPAMDTPVASPVTEGWREAIERAMQGTVGSAALYQQLVTVTADPALRRQLERLQSDLLTRHLPTLQSAWQSAVARENLHAAQGIDPSQAHISHGLIGDAMEGLFALLTRQGGYLGFTGTILRAAHPMLITGALVGGLAVHGTRQLRARRRPRACAACPPEDAGWDGDHPAWSGPEDDTVTDINAIHRAGPGTADDDEDHDTAHDQP